MLLFYIRHGDPIYDPDSLTTLGERQAEAVGRRLAVHGLDKIFASSSNRARLTAKPASELLKKEITVLDWCHEKHVYEEFSIKFADGTRQWCFIHEPTKEIFVSEEVRALGKRWYENEAFQSDIYKGTFFKEGCARVQREADEFLCSLGYRHIPEKNGYLAERPNDERIALFAHEGFANSFLSSILDIPYPEFSTRFAISHTGVSVIEFANRDGLIIPKLLQHSSDSHLYKEGLPLKYQNVIYI